MINQPKSGKGIWPKYIPYNTICSHEKPTLENAGTADKATYYGGTADVGTEERE